MTWWEAAVAPPDPWDASEENLYWWQMKFKTISGGGRRIEGRRSWQASDLKSGLPLDEEQKPLQKILDLQQPI